MPPTHHTSVVLQDLRGPTRKDGCDQLAAFDTQYVLVKETQTQPCESAQPHTSSKGDLCDSCRSTSSLRTSVLVCAMYSSRSCVQSAMADHADLCVVLCVRSLLHSHISFSVKLKVIAVNRLL